MRGVHAARTDAAQRQPEQAQSGVSTDQALALSQRDDEEGAERQRLAGLDAPTGQKLSADGKVETEQTPKDEGPLEIFILS